jgi:hypothetical protein
VNAQTIHATRTIIASAAVGYHPSGAYTTTVTPLDPGWTETDLAQYLWGGPRDMSAWVLLCSNQNSSFRREGPPAPADRWYAPGPAGEPVPIVPAAWGDNPMP